MLNRHSRPVARTTGRPAVLLAYLLGHLLGWAALLTLTLWYAAHRP